MHSSLINYFQKSATRIKNTIVFVASWAVVCGPSRIDRRVQ